MNRLPREGRADQVLLVGLSLFTLMSFFPAVPNSVNGKLKVVGCIVAVAWLAVVWRSDHPRVLWREHRLVAVATVGLVMWSLSSTLWATDRGSALASAGRVAMGAALLVVVFTGGRDRRAVLTLTLAFVAGGALTVAFGLIFKPGPPVVGAVFDPTRLSGGVGDPNDLAAALVPAIALGLFGLSYVRNRQGRVALAAILVALLTGMLLTQSRGGLAATAVMLGAGLVLGGRLRGRIAALCGVLVLIGVFYYAFLAPTESVDRLVSVVHSDASGRRSDASNRFPLWAHAARLIAQQPIAGVGAGNYRAAVEQRFGRDPATDAVHQRIVHNSYLEIQAELGIVGMLLFLTVVGGAVATAFRSAQGAATDGDRDGELLARGILIGLIGLLAAQLFLSGEYQVQFWWLMGLSLALAGTGVRATSGSGDRLPAGGRPGLPCDAS
ncbi:O-antigen ligase family protein [Actinopolymorpha rutila]